MLKHLLVRLCWTVVAACALASSAHAALGDPTIPAKLTISTYFRCQGDETTAALTPEAACQVFVDRFNASSQAHGTAQAWDCSYTVMTIVNWTSIRSITGLGVVYPYGDPRPGVLVDVTTDVPYVSPCYPGEHTVAHTGYWYDQGQQQNYTCDFDKPHSDLAGNQCVCKDGFAASADSSACIPLQESFASRQACACGDQFGNPLAPLTGAKIERVFIDGSLSGFPLQLTYDSSSTPPFATTVPRKRYPTQEATLGQSWSSSLMRKLVFGQVGADGSFSIAAVRGDGSVVSFISNGAAINASWPTRDRLVRSSQGYSYYDADRATVEAYSSTGQLAQMARSSGESLSFVYSDSATPTNIAPGPDYLIAAIDAFGRRLDFGYAAAGAGTKLVAVVGPSGVPITLSYDGAGNLTSLRWQDGSSKVFSYAASGFPNALTGITDELAVRYAAFSYDMAGRAVSSQHAGGLDAYSVTYGTPPEVSTSFTFIPAANSILEQFSWSPPTASISTPTGTVLGLQAAMLSGSPRVSGVSQPGGSGCAASTSASAYDANNNLSQSDDFDGNRTCYVSDPARNLAITKVEGLPSSVPCSSVTPANAALPAGSRRSSTRWHPDWPLEVQRAEAGRLTTRVYNGQPDPFNAGAIASCAPATALLPDGKPIVVLCKQVEQASNDGDGHLGFSASPDVATARVQSWTYNQFGQVLSAKGPRSDVNDIVTYRYYGDTSADHTLGDLAVMTNAAGQSNQYPAYTRTGQVLRAVDANGIVTDNVYDLRDRLISSTAGGLQTQYGYDLAGQLIKLTLPDGTSYMYTWDDAHRLTKISDVAGNSLTYTLDSAGNRVLEQTQDAAGNVARRISRAFDALGRLQQVTGAQR